LTKINHGNVFSVILIYGKLFSESMRHVAHMVSAILQGKCDCQHNALRPRIEPGPDIGLL